MLRFKEVLVSIFSILTLVAIEPELKFEGIFWEKRDEKGNWRKNVDSFLPYNPIIVEVGGYKGENTQRLAKRHPQGQIFVFEPGPLAFQDLKRNTEGLKNVSIHNLALHTYNGTVEYHICHGIYATDLEAEKYNSLLKETKSYTPFFRGPTIDVPCVCLDDWCRDQMIDRIDYLELDAEGSELQILRSSPQMLRTLLVICTKTNFSDFKIGTTDYFSLKVFLEANGFEQLCHWYYEGLQGEAIFIRKYVYDALFR